MKPAEGFLGLDRFYLGEAGGVTSYMVSGRTSTVPCNL